MNPDEEDDDCCIEYDPPGEYLDIHASAVRSQELADDMAETEDRVFGRG